MFKEFAKIPRLSRDCVITEKLDGTNACVVILEQSSDNPLDITNSLGNSGNQYIFAQSRNKVITPENDNYGFARWVHNNSYDLFDLGIGYHYGEWWGQGIQRNYGAKQKYFSLFNTTRWSDVSERPACCLVVPVMYEGMFSTQEIDRCIDKLNNQGSQAIPFMNPEGIIIYHTAAKQYFKKTCTNDEKPKGKCE